MAIDQETALRAYDRSRRRVSPERATIDPFDAGSLLTVTSTQRSRPIYTHPNDTGPVADALFTKEVAAAEAAPALVTDGFETLAFGAVALHWRNAPAATRTGVSFTPWVLTGTGWVRTTDGATAGLAEATELRLAGVAYRRFYIQVTALVGGAGNVLLYVGGEA